MEYNAQKTTNIQSNYVVINNYNNYVCPSPFAMNLHPNMPYSFDYTNPYTSYYYPYAPTYFAAPNSPSESFVYRNYATKEPEEKKKFYLEELLININEAVKDQNSCRFLQKKLEEDNSFANKVFDALIDSIINYMNDPFGNYLCQKLFEKCELKKLGMVIDKISGEVVNIATNLHGTRAIQKLIERSVTDEILLLKIIEMMRTHITDVIMDTNGNHVIQLCLISILAPYNDFIYDEVRENCLSISTHKHGCCILQKCIDYATPIQKVITTFIIGKFDNRNYKLYSGNGQRSIWKLCYSVHN